MSINIDTNNKYDKKIKLACNFLNYINIFPTRYYTFFDIIRLSNIFLVIYCPFISLLLQIQSYLKK